MLTTRFGEAAAATSTAAEGGRDRYRPSREVVTARRDGRCVLLDLRRTRYWGLDETGTRIWDLLLEGVPFDLLIDRLVEEYGEERVRLEADARRFLDTLCATGLVVPA